MQRAPVIQVRRPFILRPRGPRARADGDGIHLVLPLRQTQVGLQGGKGAGDAVGRGAIEGVHLARQSPREKLLGERGPVLVAESVLGMQPQRVAGQRPQVVAVQVLGIRLDRRKHGSRGRQRRLLVRPLPDFRRVLPPDHHHPIPVAPSNHRAIRRPDVHQRVVAAQLDGGYGMLRTGIPEEIGQEFPQQDVRSFGGLTDKFAAFRRDRGLDLPIPAQVDGGRGVGRRAKQGRAHDDSCVQGPGPPES